MKMSGDVKLGERLFNVVNYDAITVANEAYIHCLMRKTGLDLPLPFGEGETDLEYQVRLQARVVDTLKLPELLGGFLLAPGKTETDWTEEMAAATATYIRGLQDRDAREEVFKLAFQVNLYFFREGLISLQRSQSSMESLMKEGAAQGSPKSTGPTSNAAH